MTYLFSKGVVNNYALRELSFNTQGEGHENLVSDVQNKLQPHAC